MTTTTTILIWILVFLALGFASLFCWAMIKLSANKKQEDKKEDEPTESTATDEDGNSDETDTGENGEGTSTTSEEEVKPCACTEVDNIKKATETANAANKKATEAVDAANAAGKKAAEAVNAANATDKKATEALEANQATDKKVEKLSKEQKERYREKTQEKRNSLVLEIADLEVGISIRNATIKALAVKQGQVAEAQNTLKEKKQKVDSSGSASAILHNYSAYSKASVERTVRPAEMESEEAATKAQEKLDKAGENQNSKLCDHQTDDNSSTELAKAIAELQKEIGSFQKEIDELSGEVLELSEKLKTAKGELDELDKPLR
jgi:chromosome segregation ATPase